MNEDILIGTKSKDEKTSFFGPWMLMDYITDGRIIVSMGIIYDCKEAQGFAGRMGLVLPKIKFHEF